MQSKKPVATCQCGYELFEDQRCPECGIEFSFARRHLPIKAQLKYVGACGGSLHVAEGIVRVCGNNRDTDHGIQSFIVRGLTMR